MDKLVFDRRKYGSELLIDASTMAELNPVSDTLVMSFYALAFLEQSTGVYYLDTERLELQDHCVLFIQPGQVNRIAQAQFELGHFIFFEGFFLDEFFNDKNFIYKFGYFHQATSPALLPLEKSLFDRYNGLAAEIRAELRQLSQDSHHVLRALMYYLLVQLHRDYGKKYGGKQDLLLHPTVLQFLRLLDKGVKERQQVQDYAEQLHISRVQLNKLCQRYFSKTAHQLIREHLVAEIKKAIKYSEQDLAEIAYQFNFSAPSHFTRFFKRMTQQSPQEFREALSNW